MAGAGGPSCDGKIVLTNSLYAEPAATSAGNALKTNSMTRTLLAHSFRAALSAFVLGLYLIPALAVVLVFFLIGTRRMSSRLGDSAAIVTTARQYLWSCIFFCMDALLFGETISGIFWNGTGLIFIGAIMAALTCVALYPMQRDAKRLAGAATSGPISH